MLSLYHNEIPAFLEPFLRTAEMERLKYVGMNCGCEYTSFPLFKNLPPYSRFDHSLGTALIVWHFTQSREQALAALFHDIATPVFAHCIDFMRGDYLKQESTEDRTSAIIGESRKLTDLLRRLGISVGRVKDYHLYPIADNASPRLSADRLEYTLGNLLGYAFCSFAELQRFYGALRVESAEDGKPELTFTEISAALGFARMALRCSKVYVSGEDRYAMQMIAELMREAAGLGLLTEKDLYRTEPEVIALIERSAAPAERWQRIRALHRLVRAPEAPPELRRVVRAKKRYIDPLTAGLGRLSAVSAEFRAELNEFLESPQDEELCAV